MAKKAQKKITDQKTGPATPTDSSNLPTPCVLPEDKYWEIVDGKAVGDRLATVIIHVGTRHYKLRYPLVIAEKHLKLWLDRKVGAAGSRPVLTYSVAGALVAIEVDAIDTFVLGPPELYDEDKDEGNDEFETGWTP